MLIYCEQTAENSYFYYDSKDYEVSTLVPLKKGERSSQTRIFIGEMNYTVLCYIIPIKHIKQTKHQKTQKKDNTTCFELFLCSIIKFSPKKFHTLKPLPSSSKKSLHFIQSIYPIRLSVGVYGEYNIQMNNSPGKHLGNTFYSEQIDTFANKYIADYPSPHPGHYNGHLLKEQIESEIESLNSILNSILPDRLRLGDFFSHQLAEVEKTLEVLRALLSQRQRDLQTKNQTYANSRKAEAEKGQLMQQVQKLQRELKRAQNEKESLTMKLKVAEKTAKQNYERLTQQKDEYAKKYKAIETRQTQFKNENRKLQSTIKNLQEKITRGQEKVPYKNNFEVMHQLQSYGPSVIMMNADHEYNQVVARTMQENYLQITRENQYYRDCLQSIQKELQGVLQVKREVLRKRRGYDSDLDNVFQLKQFKGELLNLPQKVSTAGLAQLGQNVSRFREALKIGQSLDDRENEQKSSCVGNIKSLIKNYKNVVQSQQQLLGKVILKAKEFKAAEMQALQNRHSKGLDQDELDRARRFLQEQSTYLDGKNRQLEATRKAMQSTIRKVEQERQEFARRAAQANEEMGRVKKQVEMLPALIEQQLGNL